MTHHNDKIPAEVKAEFARIRKMGPGKEAIRAFVRFAVRLHREEQEKQKDGTTNPAAEVGGAGAAL